MASSSSTSSIQKTFKYDVFLSFRGKDTRTNFVDHLYTALQQQGIHTFKDDERMKQGKRIDDQLISSIEDSKYFIIVFSQNYASSSWCLDELVQIMECHNTMQQRAYPVFYKVKPSDVRKQHGKFGKAFSKHKNEESVGKWRHALEEAANLVGRESEKVANGHEVKLIQKIVEEISRELRSINSAVDEKLVGMESRMKQVLSIVETGSDEVRMIGIKGMGGAGKTTLARAVFDQIRNQFDGNSFVENVREVSKNSLLGLKSLQKQVLSDVLTDQSIIVNSVYDGKNMMRSRLCGRRVMVVLDDVDHTDQLEALAGAPNWFKPGSIIIITTRDEQVLVAHQMIKWRCDINLLSDDEAICLFSRYSFGREIPVEGYEELSTKVIRYAGGLPLTIKVLGSFLCGKETSEWIDALERLKTIPEEETLKKLELSYNGLENDYKEIFLDVACLLKGWNKREAIELLESCGFHARNGLRVLEQRSLITIKDDSDEEIIDMHDHIEEMGKNIVRRLDPAEPEKHSRLWIQEEVEDVLANDRGTEATRCVSMLLTREIITKGIRNIGSMKKLRCLIVQHKRYYDDFGDFVMNDEVSQIFPDALRYLDWYAYPHWRLPKSFQANNLVALKMNGSKIEQLWEGGKVLKKLKSLELGHSRLRTLHLWMIPNVERLDLEGSFYLVELHVPIGSLKSLIYLNLKGCTSLISLSFIKHLESLKVLNLSKLFLREFPDIIPGHSANRLETLDFSANEIEEVHSSIGNLHQLVHLDLSSCTNLKSLPQSFCNLQNLRTLNLGDSGMEELPENFGHLKCLEKLHLQWTHIKHLPDSICMLKHLKTLLLRCVVLESLPEDLGELESLEELDLSCCKIRDIPSSICKLKRLKTLILDGCEIQKLPEDFGQIESLEKLKLLGCKIKDIPASICKLKHLKELDLYGCSELDKLPEDLGELESLEKLDLSVCKIKDIPASICKLKHLKELDLYGCSELDILPEDFGQIESLKKLSLRDCKIKDIPASICKLKHLKELDLSECSELDKLPENLGDLKSLKKLNLMFSSISHLPQSVSFLNGLQIVGFRIKKKICIYE